MPTRSETRENAEAPRWPGLGRLMTGYQRFEHVVAIALSGVIASIIVISLIQLLRTVAALLVARAFHPLDHEVFQLVFGMIMTLLIALELKHSIIRVAFREDSIVQVKRVVLIAIIALSRKFVILDATVTGADKIAAPSGAILALGGVDWLMREWDDPLSRGAEADARARSSI